MEQWSPSSRTYGAAAGVDVTAVKNSNGNHMFVGKSRPLPFELPSIPSSDTEVKAKKNKKKKTTLALTSQLWWTDPEIKRKRRVAEYKMYSAEGKLKDSLRKGFRWIKHKCSRIVHGF